ncbi:MAG: GGDEF-domain containing protein, partial [Mesorhizobium sp.]
MQLTEDVARRVTEAISRPSWKSADPTLYAMLLQKNADQNRKVVRWGIAAAVLSYISYGAFDLFLFPDVADRLILTRLSLGLTFLVLVELVARRGFAITTLHYVAA